MTTYYVGRIITAKNSYPSIEGQTQVKFGDGTYLDYVKETF